MNTVSLDWNKLNILVVEDDHNLREVIVEMFESKACTVSNAENGSIALAILEQKNIDVVFSDIRMPVMDGVEMLKRIEARKQEKPFVFLATGHADIDEQEVKKLGAKALFYKPFFCDKLISELEDILVCDLKNTWVPKITDSDK